MDPEQQWCGNDGCPHFGQVGVGNIKVYSYVERRYYCVTCGQTFSAETGTFFETLRTVRSIVLDAVAMLFCPNRIERKL